MLTDENIQDLWGEFQVAGEAEPPSLPADADVGKIQRLHPGERLLGWFMTGGLSVLLLALAIQFFIDETWLGFAFVTVFFFKPLFGRYPLASKARFVAVLSTAILGSTIIPTLARITHWRIVFRDYPEPYRLLRDFQENLQSILNWPATLTLVVASILFLLAAEQVQKRYPWLNPRAEFGRIRMGITGLVLGFPVVLSLIWFVQLEMKFRSVQWDWMNSAITPNLQRRAVTELDTTSFRHPLALHIEDDSTINIQHYLQAAPLEEVIALQNEIAEVILKPDFVPTKADRRLIQAVGFTAHVRRDHPENAEFLLAVYSIDKRFQMELRTGYFSWNKGNEKFVAERLASASTSELPAWKTKIEGLESYKASTIEEIDGLALAELRRRAERASKAPKLNVFGVRISLTEHLAKLERKALLWNYHLRRQTMKEEQLRRLFRGVAPSTWWFTSSRSNFYNHISRHTDSSIYNSSYEFFSLILRLKEHKQSKGSFPAELPAKFVDRFNYEVIGETATLETKGFKPKHWAYGKWTLK